MKKLLVRITESEPWLAEYEYFVISDGILMVYGPMDECGGFPVIGAFKQFMSAAVHSEGAKA